MTQTEKTIEMNPQDVLSFNLDTENRLLMGRDIVSLQIACQKLELDGWRIVKGPSVGIGEECWVVFVELTPEGVEYASA